MTSIDAYVAACHHIAELAAQTWERWHTDRKWTNQIARDAYQLADILPDAMNAINNAARLHHDGWPERGDTVGRGTGTPRPTERLAGQRTNEVTRHADDIAENLAGAVRCARQLATEPNPENRADYLRTTRKLLAQLASTVVAWLPQPTAAPPLCKGTGDEYGSLCEQYAAGRYRADGTFDGVRCLDCLEELEQRDREKADDQRRAEQARRNRIAQRLARHDAARQRSDTNIAEAVAPHRVRRDTA